MRSLNFVAMWFPLFIVRDQFCSSIVYPIACYTCLNNESRQLWYELAIDALELWRITGYFAKMFFFFISKNVVAIQKTTISYSCFVVSFRCLTLLIFLCRYALTISISMFKHQTLRFKQYVQQKWNDINCFTKSSVFEKI